jgi:hypothetical protein
VGTSSSSNEGPAVLPRRPEGSVVSTSPSGLIMPVMTSMAEFISLDRRRLESGAEPKCWTINCSTRE